MEVVTLLYHRVNELKADINMLAVSPDRFYAHMKYLKEHYQIVRFEENWDLIDADRAVCITFDDGFIDNIEFALPILEELKIPATIFVSTCALAGIKHTIWPIELEEYLLLREDFREEFQLMDDIYAYKWKTETEEERKDLYDILLWLMRDRISHEKIYSWLGQLKSWCGCENDMNSQNHIIYQNKALIERMQSDLLSIGAHTVNHYKLARLSPEEQKKEIVESKRTLEEILQKEVTIFSYPFGGEMDYTDKTIQICKEAGIKKAASNFGGVWHDNGKIYEVPRNIVRDWEIEEFENRLEGFWRT